MSGRTSQRKGRAAELELARILQGHGYPVEAGRAQSYGEVPDLSGLPGVHIECKRHERAQIWEWMEQSRRDAAKFKDGWPTVIFRRSRSDWLICMELRDWLELYAGTAGDGQNTEKENYHVVCKNKIRGNGPHHL